MNSDYAIREILNISRSLIVILIHLIIVRHPSLFYYLSKKYVFNIVINYVTLNILLLILFKDVSISNIYLKCKLLLILYIMLVPVKHLSIYLFYLNT